jgi:hypothetical protein
MVIVTVTEHNRIDQVQSDTKMLRILFHNLPLARVEQYLLPVQFDPQGQPMLCQ